MAKAHKSQAEHGRSAIPTKGNPAKGMPPQQYRAVKKFLPQNRLQRSTTSFSRWAIPKLPAETK
jgi:hypothetical protein